MKYKIRKYSNLKKRAIFDTYEPKKRIEFSKEEALPVLFRVGHRFVVLGGSISFIASSILMTIRGVFVFKKKVDRFSFNSKMVEIRIKKS